MRPSGNWFMQGTGGTETHSFAVTAAGHVFMSGNMQFTHRDVQQLHGCSDVHEHAVLVCKVCTHTHTVDADTGILDSLSNCVAMPEEEERQRAREQEKHQCCCKDIIFIVYQGKWWHHKTVMTVKAFSHGLTGRC